MKWNQICEYLLIDLWSSICLLFGGSVFVFKHNKNTSQPQYRPHVSPRETLAVTAEKTWVRTFRLGRKFSIVRTMSWPIS